MKGSYNRFNVCIIRHHRRHRTIKAQLLQCSHQLTFHWLISHRRKSRLFKAHTAGKWKQIPTCISWKQTPCTLNTGWICASVVLLPELARPQQSTEGQQTELWRTPLCLLFWIKSAYNHTNKSFFEIWSNNIKPCALRNYSALPLLYKTPLCSDLNSV